MLLLIRECITCFMLIWVTVNLIDVDRSSLDVSVDFVNNYTDV